MMENVGIKKNLSSCPGKEWRTGAGIWDAPASSQLFSVFEIPWATWEETQLEKTGLWDDLQDIWLANKYWFEVCQYPLSANLDPDHRPLFIIDSLGPTQQDPKSSKEPVTSSDLQD